MQVLSEIVLALIKQIPWISAVSIVFMAVTHGYNHISYKHDKTEITLDK